MLCVDAFLERALLFLNIESKDHKMILESIFGNIYWVKLYSLNALHGCFSGKKTKEEEERRF